MVTSMNLDLNVIISVVDVCSSLVGMVFSSLTSVALCFLEECVNCVLTGRNSDRLSPYRYDHLWFQVKYLELTLSKGEGLGG